MSVPKLGVEEVDVMEGKLCSENLRRFIISGERNGVDVLRAVIANGGDEVQRGSGDRVGGVCLGDRTADGGASGDVA